MRRLRHILLMMIVLIMMLSTSAFADEGINLNNPISIEISYINNSVAVSGCNVKLYRIADISEFGDITVTEEFAKYNVDLNDSSETWENKALTLKGYAVRDNLKPLAKGVTDSSGRLEILKASADEKAGLFLIVPEMTKLGGYKYIAQPSIVGLPYYDSDFDTYFYEIAVTIKSERTKSPAPDEAIDISAIKIWEDEGHETKRPKEINIQLLKDNKVFDTQTLSKDNNWKYKWEKLDSDCEWTVVEEDSKDYNVEVNKEKYTFYVTNSVDSEDPPDPPNPPIPFTGRLWWPVPILVVAGLLLIIIGLVKGKGEYEDD